MQKHAKSSWPHRRSPGVPSTYRWYFATEGFEDRASQQADGSLPRNLRVLVLATATGAILLEQTQLPVAIEKTSKVNCERFRYGIRDIIPELAADIG